MFTGIVTAVGRIDGHETKGDGIRIALDATELDLGDVAIGDSIALSGCCLTVVEKASGKLYFDVSAETLRCTTGFSDGRFVNLEKALRFSDRLGGHLVTGHVDGIGKVLRFESLGGSYLLEVEAPEALARFIAAKGSIAIDGVSLTVNEVSARRFAINLIPHTLEVTTLKKLAFDSRVNLEIDLVARYVARWNEFDERASGDEQRSWV